MRGPILVTFWFFIVLFLCNDTIAQEHRQKTDEHQKIALLNNRKDSWFSEDKAHHFMASAYIAALVYYYTQDEASWSHDKAIALGIGFSFSLGLSKEIHDKHSKSGQASWKDMVANVCGIAVGLLIFSNS